ncbi:MAG: hypothetical protein CM1200mP38_6780 [Dehalococcoidia bacterium]|nr:MAG: hypothetical protein CM1200mP38_6780 [Dehalococcoidia bacterium]
MKSSIFVLICILGVVFLIGCSSSDSEAKEVMNPSKLLNLLHKKVMKLILVKTLRLVQ